MKNYVKTYKGFKVPEGATHFMDDLFYKDTGTKWLFHLMGNDWRIATMPISAFNNITELPLADEFVTEVGFHGECDYAGKVLECVVVINNRVCIFGDGFEFMTEIVDSMNIRPIKSEREKFIGQCEFIAGNYGDLYDNGARFTEGGE